MNTATITAINALDFQKYDTPIPSRTFILDLLDKHKRPLNRDQLAKALKLSGKEQKEALRRRLRAMERDGQVLYCQRQGYSILDQSDLLCGRITGHRDGFGFLTINETDDDLFVPHSQMRQVFDGDSVQVRISGVDRRGRKEVCIVKVLERCLTQVTGRLAIEQNSYFLLPENCKTANKISLDQNQLMGATVGQYVVATIVEYPSHRANAFGRITEVLGDATAPGLEIDLAIRNHDIPNQWPKKATLAANHLGVTVKAADKRHRVDLRSLPFITIDGDDAKDFDDAVYCEPEKNGGWRLFVAIADVSHYVKPGSPLDREAQKRGTSVYFPGQVVPMLPEALSNGLCSLNPNTDRLVMVCEMTINRAGKMTAYQFSEGVIHSHARLTYNQVNALLTAPQSKAGKSVSRAHTKLIPHIKALHQLYGTLQQARSQRGSIDFDTKEVQFQFNRARKIEQIKPVLRNDAHRLIEECMLCANVATAQFLAKHKLTALYRIHEGPQQKKLDTIRGFLAENGLQLAGGNSPSPRHYDQILRRLGQRSDAKVIQTMMLRSLSQAEYSPDNLGHFGLAYTAYAHFTSPIRRYPDLLVHRAIRSVIRREERDHPMLKAFKSLTGIGRDHVVRVSGAKTLDPSHCYPYDKPTMESLAEHCSQVSRRADKASREVENWLKCEYMQDKVGTCLPGVISSVTHFGLFVELEDTQVEGLIHISTLNKDAYQFDQRKQCLLGERSKISYRLGDVVQIQIARVDINERKIEFILADQAPKKTGRPHRRKASSKAINVH